MSTVGRLDIRKELWIGLSLEWLKSFWTGEDEPLIERNLEKIRLNIHLFFFHFLLLFNSIFSANIKSFRIEIASDSESDYQYKSISSYTIYNPIYNYYLHSWSSHMKLTYSLGSHCSFPHLEFLTPDKVLNQCKLVLLSLRFLTYSIFINRAINKGANGEGERLFKAT